VTPASTDVTHRRGAPEGQSLNPGAASDLGDHWGSDVEDGVVDGHPCRIFSRRRQHVADLLDDAMRWRDRSFLIQGDVRISFGEFNAAVRATAARLALAGLQHGDRVMLLGANSPEWVVAFFAVLKVDAVVVAGNSWWSSEEAEGAVGVVAPRLVVCDEKRASLVPHDVDRLLFVETVVWDVSTGSSPTPAKLAVEDDPAVIIFTSGTTGAPKAATLAHRAVIANQQNQLSRAGRMPSQLADDHRGAIQLISVPLFHTGGIQSILTNLLTGGTLVFLRGGFEAAEVLATIERERVTGWGGVPTMITRVLDHPDFRWTDLSSLTSLTIAGTYVSPDLMERVRRELPDVRRRAGTIYGMTESGGVLTAVGGLEMESRPGTVGRPLPTVELRISGPGDDGVGEIEARSPAAMTGYWGVSDSGIFDSAGWLRTGDTGRLDEDGYLYVVGRSKDIVIRGGENIACANVEAAILSYPGVAEAAVVGIPDADFGEVVGAVLVPRPGATLDTDEVGRHVAGRLAYFEVPTRWWVRGEPLPTNATGKTVKRELLIEWLELHPDD
jgi:long-chain acyl-CoA synthetase